MCEHSAGHNKVKRCDFEPRHATPVDRSQLLINWPVWYQQKHQARDGSSATLTDYGISDDAPVSAQVVAAGKDSLIVAGGLVVKMAVFEYRRCHE